MKSRLYKFLTDTMRMTEVYQPVIISELLRNKGSCTKTELALALARYDNLIIEHYKDIVMRWPKKILTKHGIIKYNKSTKTFTLKEGIVDIDDADDELRKAEEKISDWISEKKRKDKSSPEVNPSKRYSVLKRDKQKCQLCGIHSYQRPIDVDHVVPAIKQDKYGKVYKDGAYIHVHSEENLQALCLKCNRAKRDCDDTDFRRIGKLVRDKIPGIIKQEGRNPKLKQLKGKELVSALNDKLVEEYEEYFDEEVPKNSVNELADILEIIYALAYQKGFNKNEFEKLVNNKRKNNGAFENGWFYKGDNSSNIT